MANMSRKQLITEILLKFHGEKYATYWDWETLDTAIAACTHMKPQRILGMVAPTRGRFLLEQLSKDALVEIDKWVDEHNDV